MLSMPGVSAGRRWGCQMSCKQAGSAADVESRPALSARRKKRRGDERSGGQWGVLEKSLLAGVNLGGSPKEVSLVLSLEGWGEEWRWDGRRSGGS